MGCNRQFRRRYLTPPHDNRDNLEQELKWSRDSQNPRASFPLYSSIKGTTHSVVSRVTISKSYPHTLTFR